MRLWVRWSAWLCLSLMLWTAGVESTHSHLNPTDAASCTICVVAHTASPAINVTQNAPVFVALGLFQELAVHPKARLEFSDLGIRGPPVIL